MIRFCGAAKRILETTPLSTVTQFQISRKMQDNPPRTLSQQVHEHHKQLGISLSCPIPKTVCRYYPQIDAHSVPVAKPPPRVVRDGSISTVSLNRFSEIH
jgi:hypothetical protein